MSTASITRDPEETYVDIRLAELEASQERNRILNKIYLLLLLVLVIAPLGAGILLGVTSYLAEAKADCLLRSGGWHWDGASCVSITERYGL